MSGLLRTFSPHDRQRKAPGLLVTLEDDHKEFRSRALKQPCSRTWLPSLPLPPPHRTPLF